MHQLIEQAAGNGSDSYPRNSVVIIDRNALARSCEERSISQICNNYIVRSYATIDEWQRGGLNETAPVIWLFCRGQTQLGPEFLEDISRVQAIAPGARIIIVSDIEAPANLVTALEKGARGYIPQSASLDVAIAAMRLVMAGGTFVPPGSLLSPQASLEKSKAEQETKRGGPFTGQQLAVLDRLRQGESNKIIAHNLSISECTVKVHVRNIMHKIKARNRTEIAYITNAMFRDEGRIAARV